ncbi:MAG: pantoate--beta-alanine ligase [Nitrospiraceae bacterium]|nr:pantoate--beta-alanine ligase [Nitrospiraceae bacterium]
METIRLPRIMQETVMRERRSGKAVGFVPTMGALHEGHLSLVRAARAENDLVAVSLFVNPAQFAPGEDFDRYPGNAGDDLEKLSSSGLADIVFLPGKEAVYPPGFSTRVEVVGLSDRMCGRFRPGHFQAVAAIVLKLFNIVQPARAYFGQKDYQQAVVVKRMVRDLNLPVEISVCPTVRDPDGLAMSSRNVYLSPEERQAAPALYRALRAAADALEGGRRDAGGLGSLMRTVLGREPLFHGVDYISVFDPETLDELENIDRDDVLIAGAARIGGARLIDNLLVNNLK